MKKRLHDKKAGVAILIALIVISLAEVIFRAVALGEAVLTTANFGEQLAVIALAVTILTLNAKGKDRACYIYYGAWIGYFVFDQFFELPGTLVELVRHMANIPSLGGIVRVAISICIVGLGVLLLKYLNDGTIYNKLFNTVCLFAVLFVVVAVILGVSALTTNMSGLANDMFTVAELKTNVLLNLFNNLYRGAMVFLLAFFAYDSAKHELKKAKLAK